MKKFSIALLLLLSIWSCKNDVKTKAAEEDTTENASIADGYLIQGKTVDADGKSISLFAVHPNDSLVAISSTTIENNTFRFQGKVAQPDFYLLRIDSIRTFKILVSNSTHDVFISDKNFAHTIQSADLEANLYGRLHQKLNKFLQVEDLYKEIHRDADAQSDIPKLMKLDEKLDEFINYRRQVVSSFLNVNTEKQLTALILKDQIDFLDFDVVSATYASLPIDIQNNTTGTYIADFIKKKTDQTLVVVEIPKVEKKSNVTTKVEFRPAAYALSGKTHEGNELSLAAISNKKVVLIDFWASWCQPCRVQSPHLVSLYKKYKDSGLVILSISEDTNESAWLKAIGDDQFTWNTHIIDTNKSIAFRYGIEAIPHTVLIDKNGNIAAEKLSGNGLETKIKQLLAE
ncbi:TlpA disulfide reductase family protein [Kordia jejudonensis]|uniref:TlpA disulfide reductase family protein n=1 Tax=Kordia jejudonensis TaxID=1348245 RepID=UPI00069B1D07|nr:TlpA disulfide reductase family protein [Kordia jejudonensis]